MIILYFLDKPVEMLKFLIVLAETLKKAKAELAQ